MSLVINISCTGTKDTKQVVLNDGETLNIGRSNGEATLKVDARLSRKHFTIQYVDGRIKITHHSHTNPTLVAGQGSSDFQKIKGVRTESDGCRIMAGSHRFILSVSKPDSKAPSGFSEDLSTDENRLEGQSSFWSDVDPHTDEPRSTESEQTDSAGIGSQPQSSEDETPVADDANTSEKVSRQPEPKPIVIFDDELPAEKETQPRAKPPSGESKPKKPFFPLADDFFDD